MNTRSESSDMIQYHINMPPQLDHYTGWTILLTICSTAVFADESGNASMKLCPLSRLFVRWGSRGIQPDERKKAL